MKKMFTLLLSLMAFSAIFAQYDNHNNNNHNAPYYGDNYGSNNGNNNPNFHPEPGMNMRHDDGDFQPFEHHDFDRRRDDDFGRDGFHRDHDFGYSDRFHDRDDWRRRQHRGLGLLGTGLLIGATVGVVIAAHH